MCVMCAAAGKPSGSPGCAASSSVTDHADKTSAPQLGGSGAVSETAGTDTVAGSTSTTSSLSGASYVTGYINTSGDQDWYRVSLVAGHTYTFELDGWGRNALTDAYMHFYNASGIEIASNDDSGPATGSLITFTASSSGTYYVGAAGYNGMATGQYLLTMNEGTRAYKPVMSVYDAADYLTDTYWDVTGAAPRHFGSSTVSFNVDELSGARQAIAVKAFQLWADVSGLNFVQTHGAGNITITDTVAGQAYTSSNVSGGLITSSAINISTDWYGGSSAVDSYTMQTFIHEIGHAIGLGHAGGYNGSATYGVDNVYANDTWQMSVMSYMAQSNYAGDSYRFDMTPMMADILATQSMYGAANTRASDTVYGFGSTAGSMFDFSQYSSAPALTIYDSGGTDTLNASGYSQNQLIDLRPGAFSNIGGLVGNIGIYLTTVIENAVAGSGNDTIFGNDANNTITLGSGSDTVDGGGGFNTVIFSGARSSYTLTGLGGNSLRVTAQSGSVYTLTNIQIMDFADQVVTWGLANNPDLQAANVHLGSSTVQPGGSTTVSYTVTNHGGVAAGGSIVGIYLSHSSVFDGSATLVATHAIPALGIGGSVSDSVTITGATSGNYYVFAVADYNHAVASAAQEPDNASSGVQFTVQSPQTITAGPGNDTCSYGNPLASYTVHDLGTKITVTGPDALDTLYGINHLHFTDGTVNVNDGNPLFDTLFYDRTYADVFHAGVDALAHYNGGGWHEGRDPNAFFDTSAYVAANPGVLKSGMNPLDHYDQIGWKQGLDPSLDFSTRAYLMHNPDVAASGMDPLLHFLTSGQAEGRQAYASLGTSVNGFDALYYLAHNPDIAAAGVDPLLHYLSSGWKEGRNPNPYFDTNGYLAHNPDVAASGINPLLHYMSSGWLEGRSPSRAFDGAQYLANNPDVAAAHLNPLDHYVNSGYLEGRIGFNDGIWH